MIDTLSKNINFELFNPADVSILIADDETDIVDILSYNLSKEGYNVYSSYNGIEAVKKAEEILPQLIVLDIMMPEMNGVEACKKIKASPALQNSMIAFLTARSEEYTEIACLEAGGDDFIKKPLRPRLFLSHVKALLRRYYLLNDQEKEVVLTHGDIELNLDNFQVLRSGEELVLTKKEFDLLHLLMSKPGKVFLRDEIFSKVWGYEIIVGDRTIDVHISKLREKIGKDLISTVKGVGYKFSY
jgi:two-component system alkaline phosphatase synthesis response regulator PhoP